METMERAGRLIGKMKLPPDVADPEARARASHRCLAATNDPASEYAFARFEQRWLDVFNLNRAPHAVPQTIVERAS